MTITSEERFIALGCAKGLWIVKYDNNKLSIISNHLKGMRICSISNVNESKVMLGIRWSTYLIVFDYSLN